MKKISLLLFIAFAFIYACKKDTITTLSITEAPIVPSGPDSIVYTNIPDISVISPMVTTSGVPCAMITPPDTVFSDSIDIDLDGVYDVKFTDTHYSNYISGSNPCSNLNCYIQANVLNPADSMGTASVYSSIQLLHLNDTLTAGAFAPVGYASAATLTTHITSPFYDPDNFTGEGFIAFKMRRNGKTMCGWIRVESVGYNGVIIKDFAINKTHGNHIACGQQN